MTLTVNQAFNKWAVKGSLDQKGLEGFLSEFDTNPSGGLDVNELKALAKQGLDFSHAAMNQALKNDLNRGCRVTAVRKMDTLDIGARTFATLASAILADVAQKRGPHGLAIHVKLDELKSVFGPNSAISLFDKFPLKTKCPPYNHKAD
jgi:hypothetical protein